MPLTITEEMMKQDPFFQEGLEKGLKKEGKMDYLERLRQKNQTLEEKAAEVHEQVIQLPLLEDYARLNILSRTTKGLFPDVIPDQQTLKDLLQNFEKEQGAVPLASPSPLLKMNKATMKIPNFIEYEPEFEISINDETWRQRKKALTYALLTHRGRGLGVAEEMAKMG